MSRLVAATFRGEDELLAACRAAREQEVPIHDAFTPYAVHGLDEAMGLKRTRLPMVCFLLGMTGCALAFLFQVWASASDWPVNIGGKSHSAMPALIPITFEMTVLFAAVGTVIVFFLRARLWPGRRRKPLDLGVTDDRFLLVLEGPDAQAVLQQQGGADVRDVEAAS